MSDTLRLLSDGTVATGVVVLGRDGTVCDAGLDPVSVSTDGVAWVASFASIAVQDVVAITETIVENIPTTLVSSPAGELMTIVSTSASDVATRIAVFALGANYVELPPIFVTLNGTTPVSLGATPITRINSVARVSGDLVGNATIVSSALVRGYIAAGELYGSSSRFTVPADREFHIIDVIGNMTKDGGTATSVALRVKGKPVAASAFGLIFGWAVTRDGTSSSGFSQRYSSGLRGPLDMCVTSIASSAGASALTYLSGFLVDLLKKP